MRIIPILNEVAGLLLREKYFDTYFRTDSEDSNIIKGIREDKEIIINLDYVNYQGYHFEKEKPKMNKEDIFPTGLTIINRYTKSNEIETFTAFDDGRYTDNEKSLILIGYKYKNTDNLVSRIDKYLEEDKLPFYIKDTLKVLKNYKLEETGQFVLTFKRLSDKEDIKNLAVIIMGLKIKNTDDIVKI